MERMDAGFSEGGARARRRVAWPVLLHVVAANVFFGLLLWTLGRVVFYGFGMAPPGPRMRAAAPRQAHRAPQVVGTVTSLEAQAVGPTFSSTVGKLAVRRGDRVERGQLLFRMDTAPLEARIRELQSRYAAATHEVELARAERERRFEALRPELALAARDVREARLRLADAERYARDVPWSEERVVRVRGGAIRRVPLRSEPERARLHLLSRTDRLQQLRNRRAEVQNRTEQVELVARKRRAALAAEAQKLRSAMRHAARHSPLAGVVTSVRVPEGAWAAAGRPVVRVDNPASCRVVALVRQNRAAPLRKGMRVPVRQGSTTVETLLIRKQDGWDAELFRTWLWLKPVGVGVLRPGTSVEVLLPPLKLGT